MCGRIPPRQLCRSVLAADIEMKNTRRERHF